MDFERRESNNDDDGFDALKALEVISRLHSAASYFRVSVILQAKKKW